MMISRCSIGSGINDSAIHSGIESLLPGRIRYCRARALHAVDGLLSVDRLRVQLARAETQR